MSSIRKYQPPSWSCPPKYKCYLEVMKNGSIIDTIDISERSHYIIGRDPNTCDILLQHDSISRQHAVLQYGEQGELYIADLGSSHGTVLNKETIKPKKLMEYRVGAVASFGASSRLYVLQGPEELKPKEKLTPKLAKLREESYKRQERKDTEKKEEGTVTWGLDSDTTPKEDSQEDLPKVDDAKSRKIKTKLNTCQEKIKEMERNINTLKNKEEDQGMLTDGQANALRGFQHKVAQLKREKEELEQTLYDHEDKQRTNSLYKDKDEGIVANEGAEAKYLDDSDDEDCYDRTQSNQQQQQSGKQRKLKGANIKLTGSKLSKARGGSSTGKTGSSTSFIKVREGVQRGTEARRAIASSKIRKQDEYAHSKVASNGNTEEMHTNTVSSEDTEHDILAADNTEASHHTDVSQGTAVSEAPQVAEKIASDQGVPKAGINSTKAAYADNVSSIVSEPSTEPHASMTAKASVKLTSTDDLTPTSVRSQPVSHPSGVMKEPKKRTRGDGVSEASKKKSKREEVLDVSGVEEYTEWIPPQDQSGDGRTKLNEKLGY